MIPVLEGVYIDRSQHAAFWSDPGETFARKACNRNMEHMHRPCKVAEVQLFVAVKNRQGIPYRVVIRREPLVWKSTECVKQVTNIDNGSSMQTKSSPIHMKNAINGGKNKDEEKYFESNVFCHVRRSERMYYVE